MNLDAFSAIVAFLASAEALLGGAALLLALREFRAAADPAEEHRRPLLALVAGTLLVLSLASVPLFHLLLASFVPRWPGIMCVEGVRRIGTGSLGAAGWLPAILAVLDATRLLVPFAAGAWWILRRLPGPPAPTVRRAAIAAAALGAVAFLDGALATAYVVIPKAEVYPTAGCCIAPRAAAEREAGLVAVGREEESRAPLSAALAGGGAVLGAGALLLRRRGGGGRAGAAALAALALGGAALLLPAGTFLSRVAAPVLLELPYHRCTWCCLAGAPESILGAGLLVGAAMCAGWALLVRVGGPGEGGGYNTINFAL